MAQSQLKICMNIVGMHLSFIEEGDFDGLQEKIKERVKGGVLYYDFKDILKHVANELAESTFFMAHREMASRIFDYLGNSSYADEIREGIIRYTSQRDESTQMSMMMHSFTYSSLG